MVHKASSGTIFVEQAIYGSTVQSLEGPISAKSKISFVARSPGFPAEELGKEIAQILFGGVNTTLEMDTRYQGTGAFVFRSVAMGLIAARVRLRPEGGEGDQSGRSFKLANIWFLPDVWAWADIPENFFLLCATQLHCLPHLEGQSSELPRKELYPETVQFDLDALFDEVIADKQLTEHLALLFYGQMAAHEQLISTPYAPQTKSSGVDFEFKELQLLPIVSFEERTLHGCSIHVCLGLEPFRGQTGLFIQKEPKQGASRIGSAEMGRAWGGSDVSLDDGHSGVDDPDLERAWPKDTDGRLIGIGPIRLT